MTEVDPDKVLKMLEAELELARMRRPRKESRAAFRIASILFILLAFIGALFALQYFAGELTLQRQIQLEPEPTSLEP
jgi:hypothetical protein